MKRFSEYLVLASIFLFSISALGKDFVNVRDRINTQEFFYKSYDILNGKEFTNDEHFTDSIYKQSESKRKKILSTISDLDGSIPEKILKPYVYWKYINPNTKNVKTVFEVFLLNRILVLRDYIDNPLNKTPKKVDLAKKFLKEMTKDSKVTTSNIFSMSQKEIERVASLLAEADSSQKIKLIMQRNAISSLNAKGFISELPDYVVSYIGYIGGNRTELISENKRDIDRINWLNERIIFYGGLLDWNAPYMKMPEGPNDPEGHICFKEDPIFMRIREMIDSASDSIFIDIFLFGGTLGGTIAKHLIEKTEYMRKFKNPDFKTLILHDYKTDYNMRAEMMPVFTYIKEYIEDKESKGIDSGIMLMQANIERHNPGIPFGISNLVEVTDENFKEIEKGSTYFESKIDHSKVLVVDANTLYPKAYFGSKNWTDHSGAYYYDDAIYVEGPAAAVVQAMYYEDVAAALTLNKDEQKRFYFKEDGFDNKRYLFRRNDILKWFSIYRDDYPEIETESIRLTEANVDGKIKNTRNMIIDMILNAKKSIYMEQLFIYDKYVNDALMKMKINNPNLDIKILADSNSNFGMNGMPNTIFIKELQDNGIEIKFRHLEHTDFVFSNPPEGVEAKKTYHQENHRKVTSVDGLVLLGGSSNLNPDTFQGSFREFGAQIFNEKEIAQFDTNFLKDWHDPKMTYQTGIEEFEMQLGKKTFSAVWSALINDIASTLIRSKDVLEKRY